MIYKIYLGYKVYENGDVENKNGILLKPKSNGNYYFYEIYNLGVKQKMSTGSIVLYAFGIYPKYFCINPKVKRKDGNLLNNSLSNLSW